MALGDVLLCRLLDPVREVLRGGEHAWHLGLGTTTAPAIDSNNPEALRSSLPTHEGAAAVTLWQEKQKEALRLVRAASRQEASRLIPHVPD